MARRIYECEHCGSDLVPVTVMLGETRPCKMVGCPDPTCPGYRQNGVYEPMGEHS